MEPHTAARNPWAIPVGECAPTLAGLKCGTVFSLPLSGRAALPRYLAHWNRRLGSKGLWLTALRRRRGSALLYLYRPAMLSEVLSRAGCAAFLQAQGYEGLTVSSALSRLRFRLARSELFPHELGLFLGYPLSDVVGFIQNGGRNYKLLGCWKVYDDPDAAQRTFRRYQACARCYLGLFQRGCPVSRLAVDIAPETEDVF